MFLIFYETYYHYFILLISLNYWTWLPVKINYYTNDYNFIEIWDSDASFGNHYFVSNFCFKSYFPQLAMPVLTTDDSNVLLKWIIDIDFIFSGAHFYCSITLIFVSVNFDFKIMCFQNCSIFCNFLSPTTKYYLLIHNLLHIT